jgi:hypothetical protein
VKLAASGALFGIAVASVVTACTPYGPCSAPASPSALPDRLSRTGLWADPESKLVAAANRPYRPQFELWSDGATKRRWIYLPPGTRVDTKDMNDWAFPVGTRVWKEFSFGGRPRETRMLQKMANDRWAGVAYVWDSNQNDAFAAPDGLASSVDPSHVIPGSNDCTACHGGRRSYVLGFSAVQLAHQAAAEDEVTLDRLVALGLVTAPPVHPIAVPGDATERATLGYLHANCAHCHNESHAPTACYRPSGHLDLWLDVERLSAPEDTSTYTSLLRRRDVVAHLPDESPIMQRMSHASLFRRRMPPLATARPDDAAMALLRTWIGRMPAAR